MWGKGGKITQVKVDGENAYAITRYRKDSRSGDLGTKVINLSSNVVNFVFQILIDQKFKCGLVIKI